MVTNAIIQVFFSELLRRAKEAQDHVQEMDRAELDGQFGYLNRGQFFGFVIALTAIVGAVICAALNQWQIGVALGLTGLAPVIGHFLRNPFAALQKLPDGKAIEKASRKRTSSTGGDED